MRTSPIRPDQKLPDASVLLASGLGHSYVARPDLPSLRQRGN